MPFFKYLFAEQIVAKLKFKKNRKFVRYCGGKTKLNIAGLSL